MRTMLAESTFTKGVAMARAFVVRSQAMKIPNRPAQDVEAEVARLKEAVKTVSEELAELAQRDAVFAAHQEIVEDEALMQETADIIRETKRCAEFALDKVIASYAEIFDAMDDAYMQARGTDIRDVGQRLQLAMQRVRDDRFEGMEDHVIVIAEDLAPSDTARMDLDHVDGFITQEGGATSHVAIMARSLGLPALVGIKGILELAQHGQLLAMDAASGEIVCEPDEQTQARFAQKLEQQKRERELLAEATALSSQTADGAPVRLYANAGSLADIDAALRFGADGIGLFRTEFLYMDSDHFPTEQEQMEVYAQAARKMAGKELIIRTLDIGGDKSLPYYRFEPEENPFLGCRAIRLCLKKPEILKTQLRAILRAARFGAIRIMYPMIASLDELESANRLLDACREELRQEGTAFAENVPVGMMIETPASVLLAEEFAAQVDFFSIGTNDLTQYVMAADRGNRELRALCDPFQPAVLRAIRTVIEAGHAHGIPVGMCGEFAANAQAQPLLLGLGLDEFSMAASSLLETKLALRKLKTEDARKRAEALLRCRSRGEVAQKLEQPAAD